ncbi:hypothetical protein F4777DRAFT_531746 [Nemania sp. FL0916]|nr:hypothetical protein F4777DRAFT_531746 [Nemania sp. FL0916]
MRPNKARARMEADLQAAERETIPHIQSIGRGDVQDEFTFTFAHPQIAYGQIEIRVMPQDVAGYPSDNSFLVYTNDEVSSEIGETLDNAMTSTADMCIESLLRAISRQICSVLDVQDGNRDGNASMMDADVDADLHSASESYGSGDDDILFDSDDSDDGEALFDFSNDDNFGGADGARNIVRTSISDAVLSTIRQDFRTVRDAGFRVGKICGVDYVSNTSIMTMSIKARKLGLSSETHTAWNLEPSDYVVLLIQYSGAYVSFEDAIKKPTQQIPIEFRLRKCSRYRPEIEEAFSAFKPIDKNHPEKSNQEIMPKEAGGLFAFGVGSSTELLLDSGFLPMMKIRRQTNASWDDAKIIYSEATKSQRDRGSIEIPTSRSKSTDTGDKNLPPILRNDNMLSKQPTLPLVAMQFALRYLVKCTDYCMICHNRIAENFDALKPYVCGNSLCLFQYMNLGLGPSTDHEIINQEHVVDLLVSFCYASISNSWDKPRMREFPLGLNLRVPHIRDLTYTKKTDRDIIITNYGILIDPIEIEVSWLDSKVVLPDILQGNRPNMTIGQWIVIHTGTAFHKDTSKTVKMDVFHYARVTQIIGSVLWLHIASSHPVRMTPKNRKQYQDLDWQQAEPQKAHMVLCDLLLDDLETDFERSFSLTLLLHTLPSVGEMRSFLLGNPARQLATWDRFLPAAMRLLRWIIASNRSFIVQVDDPSGGASKGLDRSQERISGLSGWTQFRFAQGSPEKEALFLTALQEVKKPVRTILAWHGSSLGNWHSIIREGLNFDVVSNGRSYGDGVYFSPRFDESLGYSNHHRARWSLTNTDIDTHTALAIWPQSSLQITEAISLNELVNLPERFKCFTPIYVVHALHWIQCRYLFVRTGSSIDHTPQDSKRSKADEFKQDKEYVIQGPSGQKIYVPKVAIPSAAESQRNGSSTKLEVDVPESWDTDDEDVEDAEFLAPEDDTKNCAADPSEHLSSTLCYQKSQTDFRPGSLDYSLLPQLARPSYATKPAQQTIQRELMKLQKVQSEVPLHELGWYMDFERIENMFQWIVELHSFDPTLPLAKDMKAAGITSVVLEIRFLRGFPVTPPFVRVIQPRFLPFAMGGGGHVTAGGAMCMELLTNTGWSPVSSMESVLLQVRLAMCNLEPKPARLDSRSSSRQYGIREAVDAYTRAASMHGWEVPAELKEVTME